MKPTITPEIAEMMVSRFKEIGLLHNDTTAEVVTKYFLRAMEVNGCVKIQFFNHGKKFEIEVLNPRK